MRCISYAEYLESLIEGVFLTALRAELPESSIVEHFCFIATYTGVKVKELLLIKKEIKEAASKSNDYEGAPPCSFDDVFSSLDWKPQRLTYQQISIFFEALKNVSLHGSPPNLRAKNTIVDCVRSMREKINFDRYTATFWLESIPPTEETIDKLVSLIKTRKVSRADLWKEYVSLEHERFCYEDYRSPPWFPSIVLFFSMLPFASIFYVLISGGDTFKKFLQEEKSAILNNPKTRGRPRKNKGTT